MKLPKLYEGDVNEPDEEPKEWKKTVIRSVAIGVLLLIVGGVSHVIIIPFLGWMLFSTFIVGLGVGFILVPSIIRGMGPGLIGKSMFGKGMFILSQLASGGSIAIYKDDGDTDLYPYDKEENRIWIGGEWVSTNTNPTVYRMGWRPFAISWEKSKQSIGRFLVDTPDYGAVTDGGIAMLNESSGGYPLFTEYPDGVEDGYIVHAVRYVKSMGRGGNRLINRAEEIAMREHGGASKMSQTKFALLVCAAVFVMFVTTWMLMSI